MRLIRLKEVMSKTGLGRSTVYDYISEGQFPESVKLGPRAVGWVEAEVDAWIRSRRQSDYLSSAACSQPELINHVFRN
ncbi:AlpA family transcriptional regulator [Vibrio rotiferianus]|uniref:AlpA family transcriptional regulator n=1 Tax=Vibrio rotiferianus TaxID=190895 RepID=UPI0015F48B29|nr:AlpA family transcriptional regulator [Vibrio rotiferianus]